MTSAVISLLALGLAVFAVKHVLDWRELARACAAAACRTMQVQLLDASVSWRAIRLNRRRLQPEVHYEFDFSEDGADRNSGQVVLIGGHPVQVVLSGRQLGRVVLDPKDWQSAT